MEQNNNENNIENNDTEVVESSVMSEEAQNESPNVPPPDKTHIKFLQNNIQKLVQIYMNESKIHSRGILLLDFRNQKTGRVDVSYKEMKDVPSDICEIVLEKMKNPIYNSVMFLCILRPDNSCLLFDINLDSKNDPLFNDIGIN